MTGTGASLRSRPLFGQALGGTLDLRAPALGTFLDLPSSDVVLPERGTYELTADIHLFTQWSAAGRQIGGIIVRFFNATAGAAVATSQRSIGWEDTPNGIAGRVASVEGSTSARVTITTPTTFRVQGARGFGAGNVPSNGNTSQHIMPLAASPNLVLWRRISD